MPTEQSINQTWQAIRDLINKIKDSFPDWYASVRIPGLELERRLKAFIVKKFEKE